MRCSDIGTQVSRDEFVDFLNSVQPGQFFIVKGYVDKNGEKADHILRFGIKYDNLKKRDAATLQDILAGRKDITVSVTHGCHIPSARIPTLFLNSRQIAELTPQKKTELVVATVEYEARVGSRVIKVRQTGTVDLLDVETFSNRKSKERMPCMVSCRLSSSHPLVIAAIGTADLQGTLLQSIENPAPFAVDYENEARSCYSLTGDNGQPSAWYIRDVLSVHKIVIEEGSKSFSASLPINAVKDAIKHQYLLCGKYRGFKLTDGQFDSITIDGQAILCDGIAEEFYFALPEHVKEASIAV